MNFGRIYTYDSVWNDGKRKILTPWKHQCETSLICFQYNLTVQSRFVLERKVIYATLHVFFGRISFLKRKAKFSVMRKPYNSLFCSDLW